MCTVDNRKIFLKFPEYSKGSGNSVSAWKISHFVKHVIFEQEMDLYQVLQIGDEKIKMFDLKLKKEFNCALRSNKNLRDNQKISVCSYCPSITRCKDEFKEYVEAYTEYSRNVVSQDIHKPRHIYFKTEQESDSLVFVDAAGVIVITKNCYPKLILKSCFRPFHYTALITPMMTLLKTDFADKYYLLLAKKTIRQRVDRGKYFSTEFILEKNWH